MPKLKSFPTKLLIAFSEEQLQLLDVWRAKQPGIPNRSEAIRALVDAGLTASATEKGAEARKPTLMVSVEQLKRFMEAHGQPLKGFGASGISKAKTHKASKAVRKPSA